MNTERTAEPAAVRSGVAPYLTPSDANAATEFYVRAFAADVIDRRLADDGKRLMHCHLYINGGSLMMSDAFGEYGHVAQTPQAVVLHLQVEDVQAWWSRAVEAGCEVTMPLVKQFWGDHYGQVRDPFGFTWSMGGK